MTETKTTTEDVSTEDLTLGAAACEAMAHLLTTAGSMALPIASKVAKTAGIDLSKLPNPHLDLAVRMERVAVFLRSERARREI